MEEEINQKINQIATSVNSIKENLNMSSTASLDDVVTKTEAVIEPTGTLNITENGEYDVKEYANANINVAGGGGDYNTIIDLTKIPSTRTNTDLNNPTYELYKAISTIPMFDTSNWTSMIRFFSGMTVLKTIPLLDTSNVTNMYAMFYSCTGLESIPLLDVSKVKNMNNMFYSCTSLKTIPALNSIDVTNMGSMFSNCTSLETISLINTSNVINMNNMFYYCTNLTSIPQLNTSNVTSMGYMFCNCKKLITIPQLDTSNVTSMSYMFRDCTSLKTMPETLNTPKLTATTYMFYNCTNLENVPQLDTSLVKNASYMFHNCGKIVTIPQLNGSSMTTINNMFTYMSNLENFNGIVDVGKAFTQKTRSYSNYTFAVHLSTKLTHDCLVNIINNLYDLNLTYNVAGGGTLYNQQCTLGSTNLAKLTAEEIAVATSKGWIVS